MKSREENGYRLFKVEHRWDTENDRWIYIEHYESGVLRFKLYARRRVRIIQEKLVPNG